MSLTTLLLNRESESEDDESEDESVDKSSRPRKTSLKRKRTDSFSFDDDDDDLEEEKLLSLVDRCDTDFMIEYLENEAVQSFPVKETSIPIILVSQLYAHVGHRTKVDRELETLVQIGSVSFVRVTETDWGVVRLSNSLEIITQIQTHTQPNAQIRRQRILNEYLKLTNNKTNQAQFKRFLERRNRVIDLEDEMESQDEKIRIARLQRLGFVIKPRERVSELRTWLTTPRLKFFRHALVKGRTRQMSRIQRDHLYALNCLPKFVCVTIWLLSELISTTPDI